MAVNELFEGHPIDYFRISADNLIDTVIGGADGEESEILNVRNRSRITNITIEPDQNGRVYDTLKNHIDLDEKNTTVINIGVGQGKTYTILQTVAEYFSNHSDTYIVIAVPYVSLVNQYVQELIQHGIPEQDIYRYEWLDPSTGALSELPEQLRRRVHVVTANCLLGDAGENAYINSYIKRKYLKEFPEALCQKVWTYDGEVVDEEFLNGKINQLGDIQHEQFDISSEEINPRLLEVLDPSKLSCEIRNRKKVVFIYDEIHDAVNNFTFENMMNLQFWKDVIHKNILLSATFTDASLPVINKLSEDTDRKIQIIESERRAIPRNQSRLYIHYDNSSSFKDSNRTISAIVEKAIADGKTIDILVFQKKLAKDLFNGRVGTLLKEYSNDNVKLCASELITNQRSTRDEPTNRYDPTKINIGTNFKTGINITKENHCFIIILPPYSSKMPFENLYGIFSNGHLDLVQALARQRRPGEIHIITMYPEVMDYNALPGDWSSEQKQGFIEAYNQIKSSTTATREIQGNNYSTLTDEFITRHKELNQQTPLIKSKYLTYLGYKIIPAIEMVKDFRAFEDAFRIGNGQLILQKDRFFGADIAGNLTTNAFTNQYINCKLVEFNGQNLYLSDDDFEDKLNELFAELIEDSDASGFDLYEEVSSSLFTNRVFYKENGERNYSVVQPSNYAFKKKVLFYLLKKKHPANEFEVFGTDKLKPQHLIYHILRTQDTTVPGTVENKMDLVIRNAKGLLVQNRGSLYYPTDNDNIFEGIPIREFYDDLIQRYPVFKDLKLISAANESTEEELKNILFNLLHKSLGDFERSERYSFVDGPHKKLRTQVL